MEANNIKMIGVIGAGQMGSGIAQWCALHGVNVKMWEISLELAEKSFVKIKKALNREVEKGRLSKEDAESAASRISVTESYEELSDCSLFIEAVLETYEIKQKVFAGLEKIAKPGAIIASNTSGLSIDRLCENMENKSRFIGMHFFGPVHAMKLIEIIVGEETSEETFNTVWNFAKQIEKIPVKAAKNTPGFIVNRILFAYFLEAVKIYEEGIATKEDIDTAIKYGLNHPMGPFALMDLGGLDTFPHVCDSLKTIDGSERWDTPQSILDHVSEGRYGRKSGEGWYKYDR